MTFFQLYNSKNFSEHAQMKKFNYILYKITMNRHSFCEKWLKSKNNFLSAFRTMKTSSIIKSMEGHLKNSLPAKPNFIFNNWGNQGRVWLKWRWPCIWSSCLVQLLLQNFSWSTSNGQGKEQFFSFTGISDGRSQKWIGSSFSCDIVVSIPL